MSDYKDFGNPKEYPNALLRDMAALYAHADAVVRTMIFRPARALDEVNSDYSTTTELADTLQREADVPFRIGHHFASELVNFGRGHRLRASEIPLRRSAADLCRDRDRSKSRHQAAADGSAIPTLADRGKHGEHQQRTWRPATGRSRADAGGGEGSPRCGSRVARGGAREIGGGIAEAGRGVCGAEGRKVGEFKTSLRAERLFSFSNAATPRPENP